MDFGYYASRTQGIAPEKLEQVATLAREHLYTPLERKALEYAEAMTATPPTVTDEMVAGPSRGAHRRPGRRAHLDDLGGEHPLAHQRRVGPDQPGFQGAVRPAGAPAP